LEEIKKFIGDGSILLLTNGQNTKVSLKKIFAEYGIKPAQIINAENFESAKHAIEEKPSKLILIDYIMDEKCTRDLISLYKENNQKELDSIICFLSIEDSEMLNVDMHEYDCDYLFKAPFTYNEFDETLKGLILSKLNMGSFEKSLCELSTNLKNEDFDIVEEFVKKFEDKGIKELKFQYLRASFYNRIGLFDKAIEILEDLLNESPEDYKINMLLFDIYCDLSEYEKAFNLSQIYLFSYPFHPKRIENYIKCALVTKSYQSILSYGLKIDPLSELGESTFKAIAAGMIIAANELISLNKEMAIEAAEKALKFSAFNPNIVGALNVLLRCGQSAKVRLYIEALESFQVNNLLKVIEYKAIEMEESDKNTYLKGIELVQMGIIDFSVFDIMIRSAIKVGRKKESIQEAIEDATKHFPEKKDYLYGLI